MRRAIRRTIFFASAFILAIYVKTNLVNLFIGTALTDRLQPKPLLHVERAEKTVRWANETRTAAAAIFVNSSTIPESASRVAAPAGLVNTPPAVKVCPSPLFARRLQSFPFDYLSSIWNVRSKKKNQDQLMQSLLDIALEGVTIEPPVAINQTCRAPKLLNPAKINCQKYPEAFNGRKNPSPARLAHMIQFGFDVDTLEIHLHEVYDVVDYFFIIESTTTHRGTQKPLLWEALKNTPRFSRFQDKVVHFVMDQAYVGRNVNKMKVFRLESMQEEIRWVRFLEWNSRNNNYFRNTDIIGFGDTDEIPSRHNLHLLKHCQLSYGQVDIGIWFPMGLIDQAFKTDHPVRGYPYTLGDPTFWTIEKAKRQNQFPNRQRGTSRSYLLGGAHFSNYLYAPHLILKQMSASEYDTSSFPAMFQLLKEGNIKAAVDKLKTNLPRRIRSLKSIGKSAKKFVYLPWFYDCNRDRFPSWERGRYDLRVFSECDIEKMAAAATKDRAKQKTYNLKRKLNFKRQKLNNLKRKLNFKRQKLNNLKRKLNREPILRKFQRQRAGKFNRY